MTIFLSFSPLILLSAGAIHESEDGGVMSGAMAQGNEALLLVEAHDEDEEGAELVVGALLVLPMLADCAYPSVGRGLFQAETVGTIELDILIVLGPGSTNRIKSAD